ncbi:MAG: radical SAM family heme chaperone HemW [Gemmatimonadales bacterium]
MNPRHLYVHVPFCARRCSYCDFAIAVRKVVPVDEYLTGIRRELDSKLAKEGRFTLDTVYLGGGTPSRLGPDGIDSLLATIRGWFDLAQNAEITIEANPDDVTLGAATRWHEAGVNRVSLGIQSFDDSVLAWMHRTHDASQAGCAVKTLRQAGIDNVSVDLIFALPEQLHRSWHDDLTRALALAPDHISLYGLTIEHATPIARWQDRGTVTAATEDAYAEEFLLADSLATAAGFVHYEVSNFARPGHESRHNSAYWSGAEYLGIGPSAHSFDGETRSWNVAQYAGWVERLASRQPVLEQSERLNVANVQAERVYLGLRTTSGLTASDEDLKRARQWTEAGWAKIDDSTVRLTAEGWLRLDSLAAGLTGV